MHMTLSARFLQPKLNHLSSEQRAALEAVLARLTCKPDAGEYAAISKALREIPVSPLPKGVPPNCREGYERREIVPLYAFDASRDLGEGWGLYSMLDSGGNHRAGNAATIVWRNIWNAWRQNA